MNGGKMIHYLTKSHHRKTPWIGFCSTTKTVLVVTSAVPLLSWHVQSVFLRELFPVGQSMQRTNNRRYMQFKVINGPKWALLIWDGLHLSLRPVEVLHQGLRLNLPQRQPLQLPQSQCRLPQRPL